MILPPLPRPLALALGAALLTTAAPRPARALDMTLHQESFVQDGAPGSRTYLEDGATHVYLDFPPTWTLRHSPEAIALTPEICPEAIVRVERADLGKFTPDDKDSADLQARAAKLLPEGAKEVKLVRTRLNVLPIAGWTSWETIYEYNFFGQLFRHSVLYLDAGNGHVVRLVVQAPQDRFTRIYPTARGILLSWHEGGPAPAVVPPTM